MTEKIYGEALQSTVINALKKNGFDARFFNTPAEATECILSFVQKDNTVAFGGSVTIQDINIKTLCENKGAILLDHTIKFDNFNDKVELMRRQLTADVHISGTNAITRNGYLVNVDANGNRVAPMIFGPRKNIVIAGINKIVKDEDEAFERIRSRTAPLNNIRLKRNNPCVKTGYCVDCASDDRICRAYTVLKRKTPLTDFTVIIINEDLGY